MSDFDKWFDGMTSGLSKKDAYPDEPGRTDCPECDGYGWEMRGHASGPYFVECHKCHNPTDWPKPEA